MPSSPLAGALANARVQRDADHVHVPRPVRPATVAPHSVGIGHIGLDVLTTRYDVIWVEFSAAQGCVKVLVHALAYRIGEQFLDPFD